MIWGCTFAGGVGEPVFSDGASKTIEPYQHFCPRLCGHQLGMYIRRRLNCYQRVLSTARNGAIITLTPLEQSSTQAA
ncbi:uncharacterized protein Dere_GG26466 [Drosophila erecta]|uniref:Uncharacterized protein n=1 Tax=Drosophila erecta TaxID=7220 RepID=A0A0Q5U5Q7_DROER|nr:uncharacterized protein Dere_GG26466 [Drosophila erecta]